MTSEERAAWQHKLDNERGETYALLERCERLLTNAFDANRNGRTEVVQERLEDVLALMRKRVPASRSYT